MPMTVEREGPLPGQGKTGRRGHEIQDQENKDAAGKAEVFLFPVAFLFHVPCSDPSPMNKTKFAMLLNLEGTDFYGKTIIFQNLNVNEIASTLQILHLPAR